MSLWAVLRRALRPLPAANNIAGAIQLVVSLAVTLATGALLGIRVSLGAGVAGACLVLLALVFWAAIGLQRELARLRQGLPYLLDEQIRKGYELEKDLRAPGGDNHVKRVLAWNNKTHELLLAHAPVHAEDVTKNLDIKVKDKQSGDLNWERDAALELLRGTIAPLKKVRKQV